MISNLIKIVEYRSEKIQNNTLQIKYYFLFLPSKILPKKQPLLFLRKV
ncbi:hypothetical protein SAMN05443292_2989 [Halpernia frigidisoli]|uniref:Uncharacterized protein n=1 Tax=Halpernia frigidisoli TaxID=1125876 RepID=A0A1I3J8K1_9FLAO|nr:hypothetical protein SAMN05443292_2989 [Halpernia frigidisoli]